MVPGLVWFVFEQCAGRSAGAVFGVQLQGFFKESFRLVPFPFPVRLQGFLVKVDNAPQRFADVSLPREDFLDVDRARHTLDDNLVEQARLAATRHFLPGSEGGGFGQNDVALPTFLAWRSEAEAGRCLEANLAQLAVIASQAFHVTDRAAPPRLAPLLDEVRAHCPPLTATRGLAGDVEGLAGSFTAKVFGDGALEP